MTYSLRIAEVIVDLGRLYREIQSAPIDQVSHYIRARWSSDEIDVAYVIAVKKLNVRGRDFDTVACPRHVVELRRVIIDGQLAALNKEIVPARVHPPIPQFAPAGGIGLDLDDEGPALHCEAQFCDAWVKLDGIPFIVAPDWTLRVNHEVIKSVIEHENPDWSFEPTAPPGSRSLCPKHRSHT